MDDTWLTSAPGPTPRALRSAPRHATDRPAAGVGYLPAPGHTDRIGGDWVDVLTVGSSACGGADATRVEGQVTFTIGDVMGHGPHLAGRSHVARTVLGAALRERGPAAALEVLDAMWSAVPAWAGAMATACVVSATPVSAPSDRHPRSDTASCCPEGSITGWLLRWSSAGHPAPLVLRPDGTTTTLGHEHGDLPIGVDHTRPRHEHTTTVPDGCTLLMFTDGVVEHRRPPAVDGLDHLAALTAALGRDGRQDPTDTASRLLAARAPLLDSGDESTLLVAHLKTRPRNPSATCLDAA